MTSKEEFQSAYGASWASIIKEPAYFAALNSVSIEKLARVRSLTDEEIRDHGATILADLRGHLQTEHALIDLALVEQPVGFEMPEETYGAEGVPAVTEPERGPEIQTPFTDFASNPFPDKTPPKVAKAKKASKPKPKR